MKAVIVRAECVNGLSDVVETFASLKDAALVFLRFRETFPIRTITLEVDGVVVRESKSDLIAGAARSEDQ